MLRMSGDYNGLIYVVTDHPDDVRNHGALPLELQELDPTFEFDALRYQWKNPKSVKVKWYKTQLFIMLPNDINTVLFLDAV